MGEPYPSAPPADRVEPGVSVKDRTGLRRRWVDARNAMIADRGARRAELAAAKGVIGSGRADG